MGNSVSKKFGARTLSEEEVKLTLPTYDKIFEQIEDMRNDEWDEERTKKLQNQKINNISILGARGTGKSSILKTLIARLDKDNNEENLLGKNIILPMIVPENISTNCNLMSMILGLFKGIVDKTEEKEKSKNKDCWFNKENEISEKYRELVRKFCFIQPDFKSVSIEQYTTENDYIKKSSEIYQADIEFISCFNEFINILLKKDGQDKKQRLIFVFIDDMDLSTHRCVDAVRTLLAYISHPRIVTVLAGDLETFEEAMTLDFIRQEQTMRGDILGSTFVLGNGSEGKYLNRKKSLTYEYLKKVMPVVYRHNLREWSLETRGNYLVKDNETNKGNNKKLVELLIACFSHLKNPPIFQRFNEEKNEWVNLPQMFHIFDHTARGLNAVYNVLLETFDTIQNGEEDKKFPQIKILLETIVGSNALFNQYRKQIFEDIIRFGLDFKETRIDCDNFKSFIEDEFSKNEPVGGNEPENKPSNEQIEKIRASKITKIFSFFVLLDFSIRVLEKNELLEDEIYIELRQDNMLNLINNPAISDSMVASKEIVKYSDVGKPIIELNYKNEDAKKMANIILGFLFKSDFSFALTLFNFLSDKRFNFFESDEKKDLDRSWIYELCCSLYNAVKSTSRLSTNTVNDWDVQIKNILAFYTVYFKDDFRSLIELIGGGIPVSQILKILLDGILSEIEKKEFLFWRDKRYNTILLNTFSSILEAKIFDNSSLISLNKKDEEYKKIFEEDEDKNMPDRLSIILSIDKNDLWKDDFSNNVRKYVKDKIIDLIKKLNNISDEMVDISCIKEVWEQFKKIYKGVSDTLAKKLENHIIRLFGNNGDYKIKLSEFNEFFNKIDYLAYSTAWYGRGEAFAMLEALNNAKLDTNFESEANAPMQLNLLLAFIHIYASYTLAENKEIYILSAEVSEFINCIYDASIKGVNDQIKSYKDLLTADVGEEVVSKFEELFS